MLWGQTPVPSGNTDWTVTGLVALVLTSLLTTVLFLLRHYVIVVIPDLTKTYREEMVAQRVESKAALQLVVDHCERRDESRRVEIKEKLTELSKIVHELFETVRTLHDLVIAQERDRHGNRSGGG